LILGSYPEPTGIASTVDSETIRGARRNCADRILLFASLWIFALSKTKGRFTFGDTGRLNYAFYINDLVDHPYRHGENAVFGNDHYSGRRLNEIPPVEDVSGPSSGSHPLEYDPTYWYDGVRPHFE
jgi:hypothetical protein